MRRRQERVTFFALSRERARDCLLGKAGSVENSASRSARQSLSELVTRKGRARRRRGPHLTDPTRRTVPLVVVSRRTRQAARPTETAKGRARARARSCIASLPLHVFTAKRERIRTTGESLLKYPTRQYCHPHDYMNKSVIMSE